MGKHEFSEIRIENRLAEPIENKKIIDFYWFFKLKGKYYNCFLKNLDNSNQAGCQSEKNKVLLIIENSGTATKGE